MFRISESFVVRELFYVDFGQKLCHASGNSEKADNYLILYLSLRLSAIIAMNSEFVGLPRLFCIV